MTYASEAIRNKATGVLKCRLSPVITSKVMTATQNMWLLLATLVFRWEQIKVAGVFPGFTLHGEYIMGGLFEVYRIGDVLEYRIPAILQCNRFNFLPAIFQRVQVMRFAVEEINNSSTLLPGVRLGYEIFHHCSEKHNFKSVLDFLVANGSVPFRNTSLYYEPKIIAMTGPYGTTDTISVAPLFMSNLIPMVAHGATSAQLSNKNRFPSFFRTVPSDKFQVQALVRLLLEFGWNWVAFIGGNDDYSRDALQGFTEQIRSVDICLAYQDTVTNDVSKIPAMLDILTALNISVVLVFASEEFAVPFIEKVIERKEPKMWIASEAWSLNHRLMKKNGIETIGTVLGISIGGIKTLQGFKHFVVRSLKHEKRAAQSNVTLAGIDDTCNQDCNECLNADPYEILDEDPTYSFAVYSAVYAVAHALHKVLQCESQGCNSSKRAFPYMVTNSLKDVKFDLYNQSIEFDNNGDPPAHYDIVYWDWNSRSHVTIGSYKTSKTINFSINRTYIHWQGRRMVPELKCSPECTKGYKRVQRAYHTCCFDCQICKEGTYINYTADPTECRNCRRDEWSANGSVRCTKRSLEHLVPTEPVGIAILLSACFTLFSSLAVAGLFVCKFHTPVVRSAGGSMCFLMLGCLCLCSVTVFFNVGHPGPVHCFLRHPAFTVFYTGCISCLAIRSFQIVCIFKMASRLPRAHDYWVKHNGQWVAVGATIAVQLLLCGLWMAVDGPQPISHTMGRVIVFDCSLGNSYILYTILAFLGLLSMACFSFSYMSTDLPKNYNEGKSITFSLVIFFISWAMYLTAYLTLKGKYLPAVNALSVLSTLLGILGGYFFPKCYIIIFKPQHNTAAFFQTAIQSYTIKGPVQSKS